jgi:hypothetical protein
MEPLFGGLPRDGMLCASFGYAVAIGRVPPETPRAVPTRPGGLWARHLVAGSRGRARGRQGPGSPAAGFGRDVGGA